MSRVAIVGSGLIGRAWALVFARARWEVVMTDTSDNTLVSLKQKLLEDCQILVQHDLSEAATEVVSRISFEASLADAVRGVDFVQENGPEDCEIKKAIFAELDRYAPSDAILSSSTSAIVASRFTKELTGRDRCLVGHPVNPPHLVPLVEVCAAPWTTAATIEKTRAIYQGIGQVPIMVEHEIEGFVLNRLQGALLAEAFRLVQNGVVTPEDLDRTVKDGLGLRWLFMGPFETIDLNAPGGIADYCERYGGFYSRLADHPPTATVFSVESSKAIAKAWPHKPDATRLEEKTQWRNKQLAALQAHKKTHNL